MKIQELQESLDGTGFGIYAYQRQEKRDWCAKLGTNGDCYYASTLEGAIRSALKDANLIESKRVGYPVRRNHRRRS